MEKQLLERAERGDAEAQFNLAVMYENELLDSRYGPKGNRSKAMKWLLAAAEQGLPRAQARLAELYAGQPDMPDGSVRACEWYLLAARGLRGGHLQKIQTAYQRVARHLTPVQNAEVSRFVQGWKPKAPPALTSWSDTADVVLS